MAPASTRTCQVSTVSVGQLSPHTHQRALRHIATFYLWDLSVTNFCPQVWDSREHWHPRMVFAALRDTKDMEKLMLTCPQWSLARKFDCLSPILFT